MTVVSVDEVDTIVIGIPAGTGAAQPVQSVAGRTGSVVLATGDISGLSAVGSSGDYGDLLNIPVAAGLPETVSQVDAEAGTATAVRLWTAQRVKQAILALSPGGAGEANAAQVSAAEILAGTLADPRSFSPADAKAVVAAHGFDGAYASLSGAPTIPSAVSQLTNDSAFIAAAGAPVQTVAGRTGAVVLAAGDVSGLATVATSGAYADLSGQPALFDGAYASLSGLPVLFDGAFGSLSGAPVAVGQAEAEAGVATTNRLWTALRVKQAVQAGETPNPTAVSQLTNDSAFITAAGSPVQTVAGRAGAVVLTTADVGGLATVGISGSYNDLLNQPALFDGAFGSLTGTPATVSQAEAEAGTATTDRFWTALRVSQAITALGPAASGGGDPNPTQVSGPEIAAGTELALRSFSPADAKSMVDTHGFDGVYASLSAKPTLFDGVYASLTGKPTLFDGAYGSLTGAPVIPTAVSDLTNDSLFINAAGAPVQTVAGRAGAVVLAAGDISGLATVATTGAYADVTGTPTQPVALTQVQIEDPASVVTGLATGQRAAQAFDSRFRVVANGAVPVQGTHPAGTIYLELSA